jgi:hypothetical protein
LPLLLFPAAFSFLATPSSLPSMPSSPPTSPQRHQAAVRQSERDSRVMGSPENRREPAASTSSALPPPHVPTTFDGHISSHLSAHSTSMMNVISFDPAPQQQHGHTSMLAPSPVRLFIYLFLILY